MTHKHFAENFDVQKLDDKSLLLFDKHQLGKRFPKKYIGQVWPVGNGKYVVEGHEPTDDFTRLCFDLAEYRSWKEYDLEYYFPLFREGSFEEFIVHDWLNDKGFKLIYDSGDDAYTLKMIDAFGRKNEISLRLYNLDAFDYKPNEPVRIVYFISSSKWTEVKIERNVKSIISAIESFLVPLLYSNIVNNYSALDGMTFDANALNGLTINEFNNKGDIETTDFKENLKAKLIELANQL